MKALLRYFDTISKPVTLMISVVMVILLGIADRSTGYEISFSIFYLLPVALASWCNKKSQAVTVSALSATTWLWADSAAGHTYSHIAIPFWNSATRFGFFLLTAFSLAEIRKLLDVERASARVDHLTGVANSRAFYEYAKIEFDRS